MALQELIKSACNGSALIAQAWADYQEAINGAVAEQLRIKDDPARAWLTPDEWSRLSTAEKSQLALDRYLCSRKTRWELGRDYERYIGFLRENAGFQVFYQGIFDGLEDMGRDLVCYRSGEVEIVQCKRWSTKKTIHEKHVFQLFGTVVLKSLESPDTPVTGTITTTTALSDRAKAVANHLKIRVEEGVGLATYPLIKCNIGAGGSRIYHLPFDQQYDRTRIEVHKGELLCTTAAEAEQAGFRRARRWRGGIAQAG
jgi:hypothetical protein